MIKRERGSAALIVFATVMFILIILSTIMTAVYLKARSQLTELSELANVYSGGDLKDVFREKMGTNPENINNSIIWNYDYTGAVQEFIAPYNGKYKIEAWGASGGIPDNSIYSQCQGGYVKGEITLEKNQRLYIYVGEQGNTKQKEIFNGGGIGGTGDRNPGASGGGATDIRLEKGSWSDFNSLKSRIMVAGAGGGGSRYTYTSYDNNHNGYYEYGSCSIAGGLVGYTGNSYDYSANGTTTTSVDYDKAPGKGGTQTSGGEGGNATYSFYVGPTESGKFGKGGKSNNNSSTEGSGGGGSGYYGGGSGNGTNGGGAGNGGGGGSSFISGHNGCNAITQASTENNIVHSGTSTHYSGLTFSETVMIDGLGYSWTNVKGNKVGQIQPDGNVSYSYGHVGNGYARITYIQ